jgi:hypothetical protein
LEPKRRPLAFISTSLHIEDKPFVDLVEEITRENGFEPFGTVGKYSAAPIPVWDHMMENIPKADCVIMAATPRYLKRIYMIKVKSIKLSQNTFMQRESLPQSWASHFSYFAKKM